MKALFSALLLLASAAQATVIDVTASGFISIGHPINPYFQSAFPDDTTLYGKSVEIGLQMDTSSALLSDNPHPYVAYYDNPAADWIRITSFSIDGHTFDGLLPASGTGDVQLYDAAYLWDHALKDSELDDLCALDAAQWLTSGQETNSQITVDVRSALVDFVRGVTSIGQTFAFDGAPDMFAHASIVFSQRDSCDEPWPCYSTQVNEWVDLTSVTIGPVQAPEPGTAVLLLAGLPLLMRRRATSA